MQGQRRLRTQAGSDDLDSGLVGLAVASRVLGIAADADQLRREFGVPGRAFGEADLLRAARSLGLKARLVRSRWSRLAVIPLPALAATRDGRWVVLARADAETVLVQDPAAGRPLVTPRADFETLWTGDLMLLARRDGARAGERRFGLSWFVPAIAKYRWCLGEVLVASLGLQIFALLTPLF